jgi:taurine transport system substrate-binding protein
MRIGLCILTLLAPLIATIPIAPRAAAEQPTVTPVRLGYVLTAAPWIDAVTEGRLSEVGGRPVRWKAFPTSAEVALAMDAGNLDAGLMSSAALAASASRGMDLRVVWVANEVNARHVVIFRDGAGLERHRPVTMAGKKIGVTFLSAAHEALLVALAANGLSTKDVTLVNVAPADLEAVWKSGYVDGICIGGTRTAATIAAIAGERVILEPAPQPPFHAIAATPGFLGQNSETAVALVGALARMTADADPSGRKGGQRASRERDEESPLDPAQFKYPTLAEQIGPEWFGGLRVPGIADRLAASGDLVSPFMRRRLTASDYAGFLAPEIVARAATLVRQREAVRRTGD